MEVYVLLGFDYFEGVSLLGVYHTQDDAEYARDEYEKIKENYMFDDYMIARRVIGARAEEKSYWCSS